MTILNGSHFPEAFCSALACVCERVIALFGWQLVTPDPAAYQPDRTTLLDFSQAYKPFNFGAPRSQPAKRDALPGFVSQCFTLIYRL